MAKEKRKHSLIVTLVLIPSIGILLAMGAGIAVTASLHVALGDEQADAKMNYAVSSNSSPISDDFLRVEGSVAGVKLFFEETITNSAKLQNEELYNSTFSTIKSVYRQHVERSDFIDCFWVVINPDLTSQTPSDAEGQGIFFARNEDNDFEPHPVTNLLRYPSGDPEISWWEAVKSQRNPLWLTPYYNAEVDCNLITYEAPLFGDGDQLLGAAGIDLNFDKITDSLNDIDGFENPYPFLMDEDANLYFHPLFSNKDESGHYVDPKINLFEKIGPSLKAYGKYNTHSFTFKGENRILSYTKLRNGMYYGMSCNGDAVYHTVNRATWISIATYIAVAFVIGGAMAFIVKAAMLPLQRLIKATQKLKTGDLDVEIKKERNDEVGELSDAISSMVVALRAEKTALNALATKDGLTGVKNKAAQEAQVEELEKSISERKAKFAVIMADVNDLKSINDGHGHLEGDKAIRHACIKLCNRFPHSPVYRIGGDEFMAIVMGEDYEKRVEYFEMLIKEAESTEEIPYTFSVGMAAFHADVDPNFSSVYARADNQMYKMKEAMKAKKDS